MPSLWTGPSTSPAETQWIHSNRFSSLFQRDECHTSSTAKQDSSELNRSSIDQHVFLFFRKTNFIVSSMPKIVSINYPKLFSILNFESKTTREVADSYLRLFSSSPLANVDPLHSNMTSLYSELIEDSLTELAYPAEIGGLKYDLSMVNYGLQVFRSTLLSTWNHRECFSCVFTGTIIESSNYWIQSSIEWWTFRSNLNNLKLSKKR